MLGLWARALLALCFATAIGTAEIGKAGADQAHDTLRLAVDQPIRLIDAIHNPNPEANLVDRSVFDTLVGYDVATKTYHGQVAESWNQIDDKTLEVKLRHGIKFHDGSPLTADDVVYSFQYAMDPKINFLFKDSRFGWLDHVDKVDDYTVRIYSKQPTAIMLARLWSAPPIIPKHIHEALADKSTFGQHPIGSGPYKVASFNPAEGSIVLVKNPDYNWGGFEPKAQIGRIEVSTIPDAQTRLAKTMIGELDLIFHVDYDEAKDVVSRNPDYTIFVAPTISFTYIFFDAADRSGIHVFKDKRVREAVLRAINVDALRKAMLPPEFASKPPMQAMCHPWHVACAWSQAPVTYDPAKAKALLAEAGLSNGFDLELLGWGQAKPIAEAVAGDLRKIGIRASANITTINVFQSKRGEGKAQTQVTQWDNGGGAPDVDTTTQFFYAPSSRNYNADPDLAKWTDAASRELDPKKREDLYRQIFDKVNDERYGMPLLELPAVLVLHKGINVDANHMKPEGFLLNRLSWGK